jgi:hypothetical protein
MVKNGAMKGSVMAIVSITVAFLALRNRHVGSMNTSELMEPFAQDGEAEQWPQDLPGSSDGGTSWIAGTSEAHRILTPSAQTPCV